MDAFSQIAKVVVNREFDPIYQYSEIKKQIPYVRRKNFSNPNCHLGQRKLLLNELQFYSMFLPKNKPHLVIYAGSASGEHMPIVLKHFPKTKFLLIDPNYHNIDQDQIKFIYQNVERVSNSNLKEFSNYISYRGNNARLNHLKKGADRLRTQDFLGLGRRIDTIQSVRDFQNDYSNHNLTMVKENLQDFLSGGYKDLIAQIFSDSDRVFIIQDYMSSELSRMIEESHRNYGKKKLEIFFLTDIRTTVGSFTNDLDVIWNNAQQINWLKILKPEYSMLKFHPPYFDDTRILENQLARSVLREVIDEDFRIHQELTGIDVKKEFRRGRYFYLRNDQILLQPWAPQTSSETRLIVKKSDLEKDLISYNPTEWENKFFYLNLYRSFAYHPVFVEIFQDHKLDYQYDGCHDCSLEIIILAHLLDGGQKINLKKLVQKMKKSKKFCQQILDQYQEINQITFFNLKKNYKCPLHNFIHQSPEELKIYRFINLDQLKSRNKFEAEIKEFSIDQDGEIYPEDQVIRAEIFFDGSRARLGKIKTDHQNLPKIKAVIENFLLKNKKF